MKYTISSKTIVQVENLQEVNCRQLSHEKRLIL